MKDAPSKIVKIKMNRSFNLSWKGAPYHRLFTIVDQWIYDLQEHVRIQTGKFKRRLKGNVSERICYSVECLVRDRKTSGNNNCLSSNTQKYRFEKIQKHQKGMSLNSVLEGPHFEVEKNQQSLAIWTFLIELN